MSNENRKLMEQILAKSVSEQQSIGSRVAALLAGTSLTTTTGVDIKRRDPIEEISYETIGKLYIDKSKIGTVNFKKALFSISTYCMFSTYLMLFLPDGLGKLTKKKIDTYVAPRKYEIPKITVQDIPRPSILRQSQSVQRRKLSELRRTEEDQKREEEKRIKCLRRAKVPLMVYSCGGFTRCFRIAKFYDLEGPPIGMEYEGNSRAALNPDINVSAVTNKES